MIDERLLTNLLIYSIQVVFIAALGTALHALLRVRAAWLRHAYWKGLLALCLALPWLQGREVESAFAGLAVPAPTQAPAASAVLSVSLRTGEVTSAEPLSWTVVAAGLLAIGVAFRLLWTGLGLWQLRRLRVAGEVAPADEHDEVADLLGVRAEIRYVRGIEQPVTFGAWRPLVALPASLREHTPDVRRAVLCHELCHVKRRDWAWVLLEEAVGAALWFHPAVWWLVSRIRLTREEAVDEAVVRVTGQRRAYLDALLAFADAAPLAPAPAFSRRRHLFRRMVLISREAVMSSKRIVASCAVAVVAIAAGSWYVVDAFPMAQEAGGVVAVPKPGQMAPLPVPSSAVIGPLERRAKPVTPENPIPRRTYSVPIPNPAGAERVGLVLTLRVTLDEQGRVAEVRRADELAVSSMQVEGDAVTVTTGGFRVQFNGDVTLRPANVAVAFYTAAVDAIRQWQYDPPADGPIAFNVIVTFAPGSDAQAMQTEVAAMDDRTLLSALRPVTRSAEARFGAAGPVQVAGASGRMPVRVGGNIRQPLKTKHVNPAYPQAAQEAQVQGVVILEATIGEAGTVTDARVLRSIPLLDQAATDAVRQWEFAPTLLNGQPVPVIMTVTVQFTLN